MVGLTTSGDFGYPPIFGKLEVLEFPNSKKTKPLKINKGYYVKKVNEGFARSVGINEFENYKNNVKTLAEKSWRFEMNCIIDIVSNTTQKDGYLGVVSYKFREKTGLTKKILNRILLENKYQEYDFINLSRSYWNSGSDFLKFTEECHPGITELMKEVVEKVGLTWDVKTETTNYSNFFILKTELYKDFINNYCIPALEYMESDDRFMVNATYDVGLSKELLKEHTELEHYPMIPFIMERLILFYISSKQFKTLNLI